MSKKASKPKPEAFNRWVCNSCPDHPQFEHHDFIKHVQKVHGTARDAKGQRRMLAHMDGRDYYQSDYEWTIGDLKAVQSIRNVRAKNDLMRIV